jgi:hypothetical protein
VPKFPQEKNSRSKHEEFIGLVGNVKFINLQLFTMPKANYHIYGSHGNVSIKREGASRATKSGISSREEAYQIAKSFSKNQ